MSETITTQEAAGLLGVSQRAVLALLKRGSIKGRKPGRDWQVFKESVAAYKAWREAKPR